MKAIQIGGAIKRYTTIPKEWGNTIGGFHTLSSTEWEAAGFYDVVSPDYNSDTQHLGDLEWSEDSKNFTYPIINKTWTQTLAELKTQKINNLKSIYGRELAKTDWIIIRDQELGNSTASATLTARANLRSECSTKEAEINSKATKSLVVSYSLPSFI